jgi:hypothetical protein
MDGSLQRMITTRFTTLVAGFSVIACASIAIQTPPKAPAKAAPNADTAFFEAKIRPILTKECLPCHSRKAGAVQGGLSMDTRVEMLTGASKGPLVVPGKPKDSLLVQVVRHLHPTLKMPPSGKLTETQIQTLEAWITKGAFDPRGSQQQVVTPETKEQKEWAYRKPLLPAVPAETNGGCLSPRAMAIVTINPVPATPTGSNVANCGSGSVQLTASQAAGLPIQWYSAPTG